MNAAPTKSRRRKRRAPPPELAATPERMAQAGNAYDEMTEATPGGMLKKTGAIRIWSQLENLHRNRRISDVQHNAGVTFYADWYFTLQAGQSVTMRWSEYISGLGGGGGNLDAAERRVFHAKRYAEANKLLDDIGVRKALHWFVINDITAEHIGRRVQGYRGQRAATASGVTIVGMGLQRLAKFYGLVK